MSDLNDLFINIVLTANIKQTQAEFQPAKEQQPVEIVVSELTSRSEEEE